MAGNESQIREIRIIANVKGNADLKQFSNQLGAISGQLKGVSTAANIFSGAFSTLLGYFGLRALVQTSDDVSLLYSRIAVLAGGTEQANVAFEGLIRTANKTYTSLSDVAQVYARMAATTDKLGLGTQSLIDLTTLLTNSFRLSGAGAQEATSAAIQLSQGFASGQLRGQELRSVLESNVVIGKALAKELTNGDRGKLYKLAESGALSAEVALRAMFRAEKDINDQAAKLTPTITQSLAKAFLQLEVAVFRVTQKYEVNKNFAELLEVALQKLKGILLILGVTALPLLAKGLDAILARLALINVPVALVAAGVALLVVTFKDFDDILETAARSLSYIPERIGFLAEKFAIATSLGNDLFRAINPFSRVFDAIAVGSNNAAKTLENYADGLAKARKEQEFIASLPPVEDATAAIDKFLLNEKPAKTVDKLSDAFKRLNRMFIEGRISAAEYYDQLGRLELQDLKQDFLDNKKSIEQFIAGGEKLKKLDLARDFRQGRISLEQFDRQMRILNISDLERKLEAGKITAQEFNQEMLKFTETLNFRPGISAGIEAYLESVGTVAQQVSSAVQNVFKGLEDALFEFTKTGKQDFKSFTQAILDDLTKIAIRAAITNQIAGVFGNLFSAGPAATPSTTTGYGGGATLSPFGKIGGGASTGVAQKASSYFPSTAVADQVASKLAAEPMSVVVNNNNNSDVTVTEGTDASGNRTLDVLIASKVREGFYNGVYDKALSQNYGTSRKGY